MYMFKDIILRVTKEVLVSQRNERSLSNGGMWEDYIKESMEIRQQWDTAFQGGGTRSQCLGVRAWVIQEVVSTGDRCMVGNMEEAGITGVTRSWQALNARLRNQE